jgi:hypothetical protein
MSKDRFAPEGAVWVCGACGKTAKDRYGMEGEQSPGWDESCMLNSTLCHSERHIGEKGLLQWFAFDQPLPDYAI